MMKKPILVAVVAVLCSISAFGQKAAIQSATIAPPPGNRAALVSDTRVAALTVIASTTIAANQGKFSDGSIFLSAAPDYHDAFIADFALADLAVPQLISDATVLNFIRKFLAHTSANGEIPIYMSRNLDAVRYSGFDKYHGHATPDGAFMLPLLEMDYYNRLVAKGKASSTAIHQFQADAPKLARALDALIMDRATGCPYITPRDERSTRDERSSFGFHDNVRVTGAVALDCVFFAHDARTMVKLYTIAGNPTRQVAWQVKANTAITKGLSASSPLWDRTDGMLYAATLQDRQIDIAASVLGLYWNVLSSAQQNAVSAWLAKKYSSIAREGYIRQSPTDWKIQGYIKTGSPPYGVNDRSAGSYDDGYWTWFFQAAIEALAKSNPVKAADLMRAYLATPDKTVEYISQAGVLPATGFTLNLESPMGPLGSLKEHSGLKLK